MISTESISPVDGPDGYISAALFDEIRSLTFLGETTLDGVKVYQLSGILSEEGAEGELQVEYWIGVGDALVRQTAARGKLGLEDEGGPFSGSEMVDKSTVSITMTFSDFNQSLNIEPPKMSQ